MPRPRPSQRGTTERQQRVLCARSVRKKRAHTFASPEAVPLPAAPHLSDGAVPLIAGIRLANPLQCIRLYSAYAWWRVVWLTPPRHGLSADSQRERRLAAFRSKIVSRATEVSGRSKRATRREVAGAPRLATYVEMVGTRPVVAVASLPTPHAWSEIGRCRRHAWGALPLSPPGSRRWTTSGCRARSSDATRQVRHQPCWQNAQTSCLCAAAPPPPPPPPPRVLLMLQQIAGEGNRLAARVTTPKILMNALSTCFQPMAETTVIWMLPSSSPASHRLTSSLCAAIPKWEAFLLDLMTRFAHRAKKTLVSTPCALPPSSTFTSTQR